NDSMIEKCALRSKFYPNKYNIIDKNGNIIYPEYRFKSKIINMSFLTEIKKVINPIIGIKKNKLKGSNINYKSNHENKTVNCQEELDAFTTSFYNCTINNLKDITIINKNKKINFDNIYTKLSNLIFKNDKKIIDFIF